MAKPKRFRLGRFAEAIQAEDFKVSLVWAHDDDDFSHTIAAYRLTSPTHNGDLIIVMADSHGAWRAFIPTDNSCRIEPTLKGLRALASGQYPIEAGDG